MKKRLLIISLLALSTNTFALINANISSSQISINDTINLTILLPDSNSQPNFAPLQQNFQVVGTAQSSSTSIINGKVSSENKLIVSLAPKKVGKLTIPAITVGNDHTPSFNLEVINSSLQQNSSQTQNSTTAPNQGLIFKTNVDSSNGYVGVPIDLTIKLYYAVNISGVNLQPIIIDGIHVETDGKTKQYQANENGHPYMVVEQHFTLTPSKTGNITIPALAASGRIDSNPYNILSINPGQPFNLQSKPITLNIKEIPDHIDPNKWLPANNVTINDEWSTNSTSISAGDPITRTITINAEGTEASAIPELEFESINGVNIYPEKSQKITNTQSGKKISSKVFKIVYIPNQNGQIVIPEMTIPWWNLTTNKEENLKLQSKSFNVTGAVLPSKLDSSDTKVAQSATQVQQADKNWLMYTLGGAIFTLMIAGGIYLSRRTRKIHSKTSEHHKSETNQTDNANIMTSTKIDLNQRIDVLKELRLAATHQDLQQLNTALISWANAKYNTKIYSVNQIKNLVKNHDLQILIDNLSGALYNNQAFTQYDELIKLIELLPIDMSDKKINKNKLPNLYPKL